MEHPVTFEDIEKWASKYDDGDMSVQAKMGKMLMLCYDIGYDDGFNDFKQSMENLNTLMFSPVEGNA